MALVGVRAGGRQVRTQGVPDVVGLVLVALVVVWTFVTSAGRDARPDPVWQLAVAAAAAYAIGRVSGAIAPALAPTVLAGAAVVWFVFTPSAFSGSAEAGPLGYANANAALIVQAIAAVGLAAVMTRNERHRNLLLASGALLLGLLAVTGSLAGLVLGAAVLAISAVAPAIRRRGLVLAGCAAAVLVAVLATVLLGSAAGRAAIESPAQAALSERRVALWHDALELTDSSPLTGVGPGRFRVESGIAREDTDTEYAHSAVLQQSAEQGLPGALLLLALFGWALVALRRADRSTAAVVVGAAGVTAFALHASMDYVLEYPVLVIAAAALLGMATAVEE